MQHTNTEDFNAKINYYSTCKNSQDVGKYYIESLKHAINIFGNQISNGLITENDLYDFGEMLSCVNYLDKPIAGIEQLNQYYYDTILANKENLMERTNSRMVA